MDGLISTYHLNFYFCYGKAINLLKMQINDCSIRVSGSFV